MQRSIDKDVLADNNAGIEKGRLRTDLGLIEFARTKELLGEFLHSPPPAAGSPPTWTSCGKTKCPVKP